ncbi:MAG: zf-HC2 domain-containing protein [Acidobacteriota bacterium]
MSRAAQTSRTAPCCRAWRSHLVEAVYEEISGARRQELDRHLERCAGCRRELAELRAVSRRMAAAAEELQSAEVDLWSRLAPRLDAPERHPWFTLRPATVALLAAALFAVGVGVGLLLRPQQAPTIARGTDPSGSAQLASAERADLDEEFARYLERSTPLLLAVANRSVPAAPDGGAAAAGLDAALERRAASRLAQEGESLAARLEADGRSRQAQLTAEIGTLFLQLSNLSSLEYQRGLAMVQATMEKRALLFQLSVEEIRRL